MFELTVFVTQNSKPLNSSLRQRECTKKNSVNKVCIICKLSPFKLFEKKLWFVVKSFCNYFFTKFPKIVFGSGGFRKQPEEAV